MVGVLVYFYCVYIFRFDFVLYFRLRGVVVYVYVIVVVAVPKIVYSRYSRPCCLYLHMKGVIDCCNEFHFAQEAPLFGSECFHMLFFVS